MQELTEQIQNEIKKAIIGKDDVIRKVLMAVLAQGHILLEDIPGVGKTRLPWHLPEHWVWIPDEFSLLPIHFPLILSVFLYMKKNPENCSTNQERL